MSSIHLCTDWTPNINHIPFFVAKTKGFYEQEGLEVQISDPSSYGYTITPAKRVEKGMADLALCPTESVISYRTKSTPFPLIGIATIFQKDVSAIAVKRRSNIISPGDMDGKKYASYNARYEDDIVKRMIMNDGGAGDIEIGYPDKFGIWENLINGNYDATWIFLNWEGIAAENLTEEFRFFKLTDYLIPYYYSPMIVGDERKIRANPEVYRKFLKATAKAVNYCFEHPDEAVKILSTFVPESDEHIDLNRALEFSLPYFGSDESWGKMDPYRVAVFLEWLNETGLEKTNLEVAQIMTNEFLPSTI
ncbi:MAG: ABC transporter substrate-binding protein [bacterium]|nr:ABC transporter substrate-binding protein [bacterium]